jgi:hypothetical protein
METARRRESSGALLRRAAGPPVSWPGKARRLATILASYADGRELDERLARLHRTGVIDAVPARVQLAVGAWDMLRFWISPAAADYYDRLGISYAFHQVLRFLDEPSSLADPIGLFSTRDGIVGHLMQVVHTNPVYDLQLLCMFDDGLDALEAQLAAILAGTHPRAGSIAAIVEEPGYHAALLDFVRRWRRDPSIPPLLRSNVVASPMFTELDRVFGTMTGAFRYFNALPSNITMALHHARTATRPLA